MSLVLLNTQTFTDPFKPFTFIELMFSNSILNYVFFGIIFDMLLTLFAEIYTQRSNFYEHFPF